MEVESSILRKSVPLSMYENHIKQDACSQEVMAESGPPFLLVHFLGVIHSLLQQLRPVAAQGGM